MISATSSAIRIQASSAIAARIIGSMSRSTMIAVASVNTSPNQRYIVGDPHPGVIGDRGPNYRIDVALDHDCGGQREYQSDPCIGRLAPHIEVLCGLLVPLGRLR